MKEQQKHNIAPVYNKDSKILILGSFPSVKSRETEFFYGHPQNRFWKVVSAICGSSCPDSVSQKRDFLISHGIAVWDVIKSCRISGSSDSSISDAEPNDISEILKSADIKMIFTNGGVSTRLYKKLCMPEISVPATALPSTSPANAAYSLERLISEWSVILKYL